MRTPRTCKRCSVFGNAVTHTHKDVTTEEENAHTRKHYYAFSEPELHTHTESQMHKIARNLVSRFPFTLLSSNFRPIGYSSHLVRSLVHSFVDSFIRPMFVCHHSFSH